MAADSRLRPLHASFIGQDAFIVHDEAHLEPAFQCLLGAVKQEQRRRSDYRPLQLAALTATARLHGSSDVFRLSDEDRAYEGVRTRIHALKGLRFWPVENQKAVAGAVAERALAYKDSGQAIVVFLRRLEDVERVVSRLTGEECKCELLTGTMRGVERNALIKGSERFARFAIRSESSPTPGTVYLVCTSAGEIGIDMSADHMVCDLTPFDSMAQRLGRVNRAGMGDATIDVVYATEVSDKEFDRRSSR